MIKTLEDPFGSIDLKYDTETNIISGYIDIGISGEIDESRFNALYEMLKILYRDVKLHSEQNVA